MKQYTDTLPPEDIVSVDYNSPTVPEVIRKYKPTVYKDGIKYCCCYGPDPQQGIFGFGYSIDEAMKSWDKAYMKEGIKFFTVNWDE